MFGIALLLFGVPWWTLFASGAAWPAPVFVIGTVVFVALFAVLPLLMMAGHGARHRDRAALAGDALLGAGWVLFVWSVFGQVLLFLLFVAGIENPHRGRVVAGAVVVSVAVLLAWGYAEAMRVPRVRRLDVVIDPLGAALDGLRVAVITDTHFGPINRVRWSADVVARVNELDATSSVMSGTSPTARSRYAANSRIPWRRCRRRRLVCTSPATTSTSARHRLAGLHGRHRLDRTAQPARRRATRR